jgi:hypothetical protein
LYCLSFSLYCLSFFWSLYCLWLKWSFSKDLQIFEMTLLLKAYLALVEICLHSLTIQHSIHCNCRRYQIKEYTYKK